MAHTHDQHAAPSDSGTRRLWIAVGVNVLLTIAQIVGGVIAGSLALIADAMHNFSDAGSLVLALIAKRISRRPADGRRTYGYGRAKVEARHIHLWPIDEHRASVEAIKRAVREALRSRLSVTHSMLEVEIDDAGAVRSQCS